MLRSVPQFPAICGRCPVESGAVAFHALTGIWRHIAFDETQPNRSHQARMLLALLQIVGGDKLIIPFC